MFEVRLKRRIYVCVVVGWLKNPTKEVEATTSAITPVVVRLDGFHMERAHELTKIVSVKNRSQGGKNAHEELNSLV